ncbi:MAG: DUF5916 domain-containing protein [Gemmatimonadaceae bacterium]
MIAFVGLLMVMQAQVHQAPAGPAPAEPPRAPTVRATRAAAPPVLDGRDDDAVWRVAPVIDGFLESRPTEAAAPKQRTEARVAYDARNLYVFVRAYDTAPDSIVSVRWRRDDQTASDQLIVMVDSYHDKRTGFEFAVNPAGVKADVAIYNDGNEDGAWDAVWDVATHTDSLGWTAEYRIPFSQLRYSTKGDGSFGIMFWRSIQRHTAVATWPLYRPSKPGFPSQFGELSGLDSLAKPGRAELTPYVVTKSVTGPPSRNYARAQELTGGGDLLVRVASNLQLNATANPDFGQVEADPSELNLSAFESFFGERRPFFVEGKGIFSFNVNCVVVVDCSTGEGLFYSRRIGRSPQLGGVYGNDQSATSTKILGAAKLTGRLPGGFSLGLLDAVTEQVAGPGGTTLEPGANYAVLRGNQDYAGGNGSVGLIATAVDRSLDDASRPYLHRSAHALGFDTRRRFAKSYEVSASLAASRVDGSEAAIARTQRSTVHLYQRPDGPLRVDTTRTSLSGTNTELRFAKVGGKLLIFETAYQRRTPGFEINDVGFLRQADFQAWTSWANLAFRTPNRVFQQLRWNFNNWEYWSASGLPTEIAFNTNVHTQFTNRWWLHAGGTLGQLGQTYCDRCARGGPAIRQDGYLSPWGGISGDDRKSYVPSFWVNYTRADGGRSERTSLQPVLDIKVLSRFTTSVGASWSKNRDDAQYFGTFADAAGADHFTFAHLDQRTLSLTWRLGYTFTPNTSLQVYASPFITKGTYSNVRELDHPRAASYDDRYRAYGDTAVANHPGGFNFQQFRSNAVFRWEYRPGSTLFLVWSQGREGSLDREGNQSFGSDLGDLFDRRSNDTFLVKMSYWFTR